MTVKEKLEWLMNQNVDPKRSQLCGYPLDFMADLYDLFYIDRYTTVYYDELAEWIYELDDEKLDSPEIMELVDYIYLDAKNNDSWGFVYDW